MKNTISFDTLMNAALLEYQRDYVAGLPSPEALAEEFPLSEAFEKRIQAELKRQSRPRRGVAFYLRRAAACVVLALALTSVIFVPVQAVRQAVVSTVLEWHEQFTRFVFSSSDGGQSVVPANLRLGYLPEGYENGEVYMHDEGVYSYGYIAEDGDFLLIEISVALDLAIDNEQTDYYIIQHGNIQYTYMDTNNGYAVTLVWTQDSLACTLTTTLSLNEALQIADNIFL